MSIETVGNVLPDQPSYPRKPYPWKSDASIRETTDELTARQDYCPTCNSEPGLICVGIKWRTINDERCPTFIPVVFHRKRLKSIRRLDELRKKHSGPPR